MSTSTEAAVGSTRIRRQPSARTAAPKLNRAQSRIGVVFSSGYAVLLLVFGILPGGLMQMCAQAIVQMFAT